MSSMLKMQVMSVPEKYTLPRTISVPCASLCAPKWLSQASPAKEARCVCEQAACKGCQVLTPLGIASVYFLPHASSGAKMVSV